ncbi:DUF4381 domain-containing protein [Roseomonas sp. M0104]|uniref:DUF4381 domain-containing protein n=1 Tax=Teichococcus coralli TaxID=2545983 RepID=A0A845BDZ5_9PROT|nr:DUF4381 domain-containing protein [Pseudoroseomonas coralli]MXP63567.1 DUF4381 domain-containing protein [Pseudoroseomonas coralli]
MNPDAMPSRAAMHGLIEPPPVAFWPATPAWLVLLLLVLALLGWLALRAWRAWRRDAYRRDALRALAGAGPAEIAALLKRTALAAWPRERVAALSGADWAAFLRRSAPRAALGAAMAERLAGLAYAPAAPPEVRAAAAQWIRRHDPRA